MKVFQVIFEEDREGTLVDVIQYVAADNIKAVSDAMHKHAEEMDWDLKSVRYALTVTQTIPKEA